MKIVVYGLGKTGTSALFYRIRNSLPPGTIALFEPPSYGPLVRLRAALDAPRAGPRPRHVVAKVLPFAPRRLRLRGFERFDKRILIVRDPRDRMLSGLLYQAYSTRLFADETNVRAFVELLRQKEAAPSSVPVTAIVERLVGLEGQQHSIAAWADAYGRRAVERPIAFHRQRPHLHVVRYEDMIEDRLEPLERYLGFALDGAPDVDPAVRRVERTRSYGGWRQWWTPEDIALTAQILQPYLNVYYPEADWRLEPSRHLNPEHGSRYVARIANERRSMAKLTPIVWDA